MAVMRFVGGVLLVLGATTSGFAAAGDGTPSDPNILYIGRWDKSNANLYHSYWGGAYFRVSFTGTTVKIKLAGSANIGVSVDGKADVMTSGANGTFNCTPTPLANGSHTLRVAAKWQADQLQFQGLVLDAGAKTSAPPASKGILEFIGNSITSGETTSKQDLTAFPWIAGESMGYDHTQISYGGITLVDGYHLSYSGAPLIGQSVQYFRMTTPSLNGKAAVKDVDWDFTQYTPKAVIINIGTNDNGVSSALFKTTYAKFVKDIRAKYPATPIVAMRTFAGRKATETQAVVTEANTAGEKNLFYVNTTGWLGTGDFSSDDLHPNDAGQKKAAGLLETALKPILDAVTAVKPPTRKLRHLGTPENEIPYDVDGRWIPPTTQPVRKITKP